MKIDEFTTRALDIAVIRPGPAPGKILTGADVLLAVEIAHATQGRDLGERREEYGAVGIPEYWVVDGAKRVIHCFRLASGDDAYASAAAIPFGEPLEIPALAGTITIG